MSLESICASLKCAKRLKEAGWHDAAFCWIKRQGDYELVPSKEIVNPKYTLVEWYPAPTAEELLRGLPQTFVCNGKEFILVIAAYDNPIQRFDSYYRESFSSDYELKGESENDTLRFTDSLSVTWCYLRKNNFI